MSILLNKLEDIFLSEYGNLPVGGWINPEFESEFGDVVEFRCHYDNFDNEEDSWYYYFDKKKWMFI